MLQVLIAKAKIAAEEALRLLLFALNGLAALSVIDKNTVSAIALYREVSLMDMRSKPCTEALCCFLNMIPEALIAKIG